MNTEVIPIRYDGLDADRHEIDLQSLSESLRGMSRILGVVGHFVSTGKLAKRRQILDVQVLVAEPRANCFSIDAVVQFAKEQQLLAGVGTVVVGAFFSIVAWIFARASQNRAEMKALQASLDKAIAELAGQNKEMIPRLLETVEKMADSLRPAARDAVAPVGKTCKTMTIGKSVSVDESAATTIRAFDAESLTEAQDWVVRITELDRENNSAKVRIMGVGGEEDDRRFKATITDPAISLIHNRYVEAFSNGSQLTVRAKATLRDGRVNTLYISDILSTNVEIPE